MEKNNTKQIAIAAVAVVIIAALALVFLSPVPSFEQEYARLSLAWKGNGLEAEHLHASEETFALEKSELNSIKNGIISFKASTRNNAAGELSDAYIAFIDFSSEYASIQKLKASLTEDADRPLCENAAAFRELSAKYTSLKEKGDKYLGKVNSFVSDYPKEAGEISLLGAEVPEENESLGKLLLAIELLTEGC